MFPSSFSRVSIFSLMAKACLNCSTVRFEKFVIYKKSSKGEVQKSQPKHIVQTRKRKGTAVSG